MTQTGRIFLNEDVFNNINSPAKAYWLGYIYCDGSIDKTSSYVSLYTKDKEHLIKFLLFFLKVTILSRNNKVEVVIMFL
jgi:hypothetical protein